MKGKMTCPCLRAEALRRASVSVTRVRHRVKSAAESLCACHSSGQGLLVRAAAVGRPYALPNPSPPLLKGGKGGLEMFIVHSNPCICGIG